MGMDLHMDIDRHKHGHRHRQFIIKLYTFQLDETIRSIGKLDLKKFKDLFKVLTDAYNKRVVKLNKRNIVSDIALSSLNSISEVPTPIRGDTTNDTSAAVDEVENQHSVDTENSSCAGNEFTLYKGIALFLSVGLIIMGLWYSTKYIQFIRKPFYNTEVNKNVEINEKA